MQQEQHPVVRQQFDFLFEALHASRFVGESDLSEAGAVEIRGVVHPGLSQHRLGPALRRGQTDAKDVTSAESEEADSECYAD